MARFSMTTLRRSCHDAFAKLKDRPFQPPVIPALLGTQHV